MQDDIQYVLSFWFGDELDDAVVAKQQAALWWKKSAETDQMIWAKFEHRVQQAIRDELQAWLATPRGRLACIILLDQFCRHIYRNKPQAFAHDAQALAWTLEGLEEGADKELRPVERLFFYLPLEHSENREHQKLNVKLLTDIRAQLDGESAKAFEGFVDYAERHRDVIERFGRFPHRNAILGRTSTPEELAFLETPGSRF